MKLIREIGNYKYYELDDADFAKQYSERLKSDLDDGGKWRLWTIEIHYSTDGWRDPDNEETETEGYDSAKDVNDRLIELEEYGSDIYTLLFYEEDTEEL